MLVPRIGETNVTIIGFLGSSAGLAIFAIGAVSGNQVLASTCAGLVSMTGMVCPFLFSQHMFLSILNSNKPLTLHRYSLLFEPSYHAAQIEICKALFKPRWVSCQPLLQR